MRDLLAAEAAGDERANLAIALFCHRLRKTIGAYLAVLGGADAVVFGGGIDVDSDRNEGLTGEGAISRAGTDVEVFVADVDEEGAIDRDALLAAAAAFTA